VSTGNGDDDAFAQLYQNAAAGRGAYKTLFVPSTADPRRDREWYRLNVEEAADPDSARREHARCAEDAFRSPGGNYFKRFSRERHVKDISIVDNWRTYRGVDFGIRRSACLWAQVSPSGQLFIVDELLPQNTPTPEFARLIKEREASFKLVEEPLCSYCDPAGRAANMQTAESEFDKFACEQLRPVGKPSSVRDGCVRIMDLLADEQLPLVVASRCEGLIRALAQVKPHRSKPETYNTDHPIFSHPLDALRYLLVNDVLAPNLNIVSGNEDGPSPLMTLLQAGQRSAVSEW
jgi:hypothetical protein